MAAASLVAGLAVLSGCGSSGDPVAQAARKTAAKNTARFTLRTRFPKSGTLSLSGGNGSGEMDFEHSRTRVREADTGLYEIVDDGVVYIQRDRRTWQRFDETKQMTRLYGERKGSSDPLLAGLERNDHPSVRIGEGAVAGFQVVHYRKAVGPAATPVEVWIDHDGLIRQIRTRQKTADMTFATEVRLTDFGTPVHITLPPPGKVKTVTNGGR